MNYKVTKDWANNQLVLSRVNKHGREINFKFNVERLEDIHIDDDEVQSIRWGVDDFTHRAVEMEEYVQEKKGLEERPALFDRTKFPDALRQMIRKHDSNYGISWDTIDMYLGIMCRINQEEQDGSN